MKAKPPEKIQQATNPSTRSHWNKMNRKQRREMMRKIQSQDLSLEVVHPDAAGIDIGNESHYVAVPPTRDSQPVRRFGCTTVELKAMAEWLKQCGIRTVAMQSTSVYWIAVYDILEAAGLEVYLVNARDTKNLPGRKSDVQESQWLMKLHTYGLLRNSFRPSQEIRTMRTYWRQRHDLIRAAVSHLQRIQKTLTQMNIQLANVLSDVSGVTGQAILKAILAGERDPHRLAALRDPRVKASAEQIARYLEGNWQEDLLFVLKQEQAGYEFCQQQIAECDRQLEQYLQQREDRSQGASLPKEMRKGRLVRKKGNKPVFALRAELFRITGTDLTQVDGIDVVTAATILSEAGWDMSKWKDEDHFVSWLRLCPDNRISGDKVLGKGRLPTNNRASIALRMAASTLRVSSTYLGAQFRRFRTKLGAPVAIKAMAAKLARLVYRMLRYGMKYVDQGA
ncbi:MAG TPA: IS110 family transposase, partial [Candidatus Sulfotelmatobacter sp.]